MADDTRQRIHNAAMLALSYGAGNAIDQKEAALREIYALTTEPVTDADVDAFLAASDEHDPKRVERIRKLFNQKLDGSS